MYENKNVNNVQNGLDFPFKKLCCQRDFLKKQAVKFRSAAYDTAYKRHKNYVKNH